METVESLKKEIFALKKENQLLKVSELAIAGEYEELTEYQTSQVRFRTVFESSRLGNKIIAPDLTIIDVNPALLALLGYEHKDDLIGTKTLDFSPFKCFSQHLPIFPPHH